MPIKLRTFQSVILPPASIRKQLKEGDSHQVKAMVAAANRVAAGKLINSEPANVWTCRKKADIEAALQHPNEVLYQAISVETGEPHGEYLHLGNADPERLYPELLKELKEGLKKITVIELITTPEGTCDIYGWERQLHIGKSKLLCADIPRTLAEPLKHLFQDACTFPTTKE